MARLYIEMDAQDIHETIPYALICMTRYGASWGTMRRKRLYKDEFTEKERESARRIFSQSYDWTVGKGVPDKVKMTINTFDLWQKIGVFCASI